MIMNSFKTYFIVIILVITNINEIVAQRTNFLTEIEKDNGWNLLFDGETFTGWQKLADSGWIIKNGELRAQPFSDGKQKDIITTDRFKNFELSIEFKMSEATNSGIKYFVINDYPENIGVFLGLEYAILDDVNFKYPERGVFRSLGSLYDLIPACKKDNIPLNKWHIAKIVVNGDHIEHWLNGKMLIEYNRGTEGFLLLVKDSKYKNLENFGQSESGHILLQNEGSPVAFRNIKIRSLRKTEK